MNSMLEELRQSINYQKVTDNNLNIPIISFFTGGGLLDMGFEKAGFKTVFANEANPKIGKAFNFAFNFWRGKELNIDEQINITIDEIDNLDSKEILKKSFDDNIPKLFGIIGGPPCQDFSVSGKVEGLKGKRGNLSLSFVKKIKELQPSFFVMENVKGLMKFKTLAEDFKLVREQLEENYFLSYP